MNAPIRKLAALATAMALATPAIAAMSPQDTTTDELDRMEQDAGPPPVSDVDDRMNPVDPEVDAMTQDPMQDQTTDPAMQDPTMQDRGMEDDRWATLDSDGDGRISREESQVDADFNANFDMMDANGDGFVSDSEFQVGAQVEPEEGDDW